MAAPMLDTDSDDELPAGWEERVSLDGRVYYANHLSKATQWDHPSTGKKKEVKGDLPYGWEKKVSESGLVFYVDHINQRTTYTDPRLAFAEEVKKSKYDFKQKFDGNSMAMHVVQGKDLTGKYVIVTGANSGIGYETARTLAFFGATVIMACRNVDEAKKCKTKILQERPKSNLEVMHLDLASLKSVKRFADEYLSTNWPLHLLILNAGIFGISYTKTEDDLEMTFQVNHLSHFCLTKLLWQKLVTSAPARVVVVSSESHRSTDLSLENISEEKLSPPSGRLFQDLKAYNLSKLCNNLFSLHLNRLLSDKGVHSNSVHPGNVMFTGISKNWWFYRLVFLVVRPFTKSMQQGAATSVYCAVASELEGVGGMYFNNCCHCEPSDASTDEDLAQKLWDICDKMVNDRMTSSDMSPR